MAATRNGKLPPDPASAVRLCGAALGTRPHVCAFFGRDDDEYLATIPFILEGLENREKAFHSIDPARRASHLRRLASAGIDVPAALEDGRLEIRDWTETHVHDGLFDMSRTFAGWKRIGERARLDGFHRIRFITHMEWALEEGLSVSDLLEYEARANYEWLNQEGPFNPVICAYDLTRFGGEVVVDVMRTHPMIIIGGILQENPFFVPPDEFLRELRERRLTRPE